MGRGFARGCLDPANRERAVPAFPASIHQRSDEIKRAIPQHRPDRSASALDHAFSPLIPGKLSKEEAGTRRRVKADRGNGDRIRSRGGDFVRRPLNPKPEP